MKTEIWLSKCLMVFCGVLDVPLFFVKTSNNCLTFIKKNVKITHLELIQYELFMIANALDFIKSYIDLLKGNQGTLHAEAKNFFQQAMDCTSDESGCDYASSIEKNRGRIKEPQIWTRSLDWLDAGQLEKWVDLKTLVCIKSIRTHKGETTQELRYYMSSLASDAQRIGQIVRAQWGVENKLQWHLDVSFGEDLCKIRMDHAAENFSLVKKMALGLLKADTSEKLGAPNKRKLAGWSPEYLLKILGVVKCFFLQFPWRIVINCHIDNYH
ncbi:MAG: ISAs1 family transposase [Chlamydiia bacterium]|nr:ISAs1 family transposase [Chlamydiia bacterium]